MGNNAECEVKCCLIVNRWGVMFEGGGLQARAKWQESKSHVKVKEVFSPGARSWYLTCDSKRVGRMGRKLTEKGANLG